MVAAGVLCSQGGPPCVEGVALCKFLECGVLANGFARFHRSTCRDDVLVAFSCKGRAICASCGHQRKLIALIEMPSAARRILEHLGLDPDAPPLSPARPPPEELCIGAVLVLSGSAAVRGGVCLACGSGTLRGDSG